MHEELVKVTTELYTVSQPNIIVLFLMSITGRLALRACEPRVCRRCYILPPSQLSDHNP